jgi:hypothetical protein
MGGIIDSIKRCAKLCDSYQKRHTAGERCSLWLSISDAIALDTVKFFTSLKWQGKFSGVVAQFVTHRSNLESDLQLHISITATNTHDLVVSVDEKVNSLTVMMKLVFERMQSPEEKELAAFAQQNGGIEHVLGDGALMEKILEKIVKKQNSATKDDKGPATKGVPIQTSLPLTVPELEKELRKDVETILAENTKAFDQKFETLELSLKEVHVTIRHQSDRVIEEVLAGVNAGPHERIKDRVHSPSL